MFVERVELAATYLILLPATFTYVHSVDIYQKLNVCFSKLSNIKNHNIPQQSIIQTHSLKTFHKPSEHFDISMDIAANRIQKFTQIYTLNHHFTGTLKRYLQLSKFKV